MTAFVPSGWHGDAGWKSSCRGREKCSATMSTPADARACNLLPRTLLVLLTESTSSLRPLLALFTSRPLAARHPHGPLTTEPKKTVGEQEPFSYIIGLGMVIKGWDEGVMDMAVGETSWLTCTPDYAYGSAG